MNESRARRYQRREHLRRAARAAAGGLSLAVVAWSPIPGAAADLSLSATSGLPAGIGVAARLALFVMLTGLLLAGLAVPVRVLARSGVPSSHGPPVRLPVGASLVGELRAFVALLLAAFGSAAVVQIACAIAGGWWWLAAGLVLSLAALAVTEYAPAVVARLSRARPIGSADLAERLAALARRAGVRVDRIDQIAVNDHDEVTAFVAGLGRRRRVFIASTLVRDWSPEEIAVVVAHELGHHRRRDLLRTRLVDGLVMVAALATAALLVPEAASGRLETLPAIALAAGAVWMSAAPLRNAQSRQQERLADAFALELTGNASALSAVVRRLGARRLVEERPSALSRWLTARHPSVAERMASAEAHRSAGRHAGGPERRDRASGARR